MAKSVIGKYYTSFTGTARKYTGGSDQWGDRAGSRDHVTAQVIQSVGGRDSAMLGNLQSHTAAFLWQHVLDIFHKNAETIHSNRVNLVWEFSHTLIVIQRMIELLFFYEDKTCASACLGCWGQPRRGNPTSCNTGPGQELGQVCLGLKSLAVIH